jgi:hypothetical protein
MIGGIRWHRACLIACAGLIALVAAPPVHAVPGRIVLLQPSAASAGARRCLTLIRDELVAGGFVVAAVDLGPGQDPVSLVEAMRRQKGAVAIIGLLGDPSSAPAELWILDNIGGNAEVRRIPAPIDDAERVAEVLAIRTVEVLRASALKLLIESSRRPSAPAPAPAVQIAAAAPPPAVPRAAARTVAIETGLSVLVSPGQLDAAAVPVARLRVAIAGPVVARLTVAGLGTRPLVETSRGAASITQALGLVEVGLVFRRDRRLQPAMSLGAGVLRASSDAQGSSPYLGQRDARWAALFDAGAGVIVPVGGQLALALEAHVMLAAPYPVVRFSDLDAATIARPAAWTTLTLVAWL